MPAARRRSFTCTLLGTGPDKAWPYVEMPFDSEAFFGTRARVPVKVTIRGVELRASLAPMGGRHMLGFSRKLAEQAGVAVGDRVRISIERDDAPRPVAVPPALARALRSNPAARKAWDALAPSHRREHAEAIAGARRPETRERRVASTVAMLLSETGRPARPQPSAKPLARRLQVKPGSKVAVLGAPAGFSLGVPTARSAKGADVVLLFVASQRDLKKWLARGIASAGLLWIAYPKTTSRVRTDLTRDIGWEAAERAGLRPVTQVAIDDTWSALRFRT